MSRLVPNWKPQQLREGILRSDESSRRTASETKAKETGGCCKNCAYSSVTKFVLRCKRKNKTVLPLTFCSQHTHKSENLNGNNESK